MSIVSTEVVPHGRHAPPIRPKSRRDAFNGVAVEAAALAQAQATRSGELDASEARLLRRSRRMLLVLTLAGLCCACALMITAVTGTVNRKLLGAIATVALVVGLAALAVAWSVFRRLAVPGSREARCAPAPPYSQGVSPGTTPGSPGGDIVQLFDSMQGMMAALAVSEGRLSEAQRLAHVGSWEWDATLRRSAWSEELHRIYATDGVPPNDLEPFLALVHPDDRALVKADFVRCLQSGEPCHHKARIVRPDGEVRTLVAHTEALLDAAGAVKGLRGAVQDVTESERTAAALGESEGRYRMLFENNPQPMLVYEVETQRFLAVNGAAVAHYGYSQEQFSAMKVLDLHPAEDRERLEAVVANAEPGLVRRGLWRHRRKDGSLLEVEVSSHPVRFGSKAARLVMANDVTERRRLEHQLRQSQKMDAMGRLASGVAHDFNNFLGVIMGYSDMVSRRLPVGDPLIAKVAEIMKAADRSAALTHQLLAFSRKQVLQPRRLDLNVIVADMEKLLRRLIGEDIELKTHPQQGLQATMADPGQMEQVIMNLAVNARDAMPNGGTLLLETHDVELDESYVQMHPGARPGRHVMLAVSDTGQGMDTETLARIYEPFFTTKPEGKGTGLGLSTVYGIVEQSGGRIDVYSEIGRGTTFKVYLPSAEASAEAPAAPSPSSAPPKGTETILLVEDEAALRTMIRVTLEQAGYRVLEAATPHQALAIAKAHAGNVDLVLTDVVMPGMSGRELVEKLKPIRPGAAVAYMSGYTDETIGHLGLIESGGLFLRKPFTSQRLHGTVREALAGSARLGASGVSCKS